MTVYFEILMGHIENILFVGWKNILRNHLT